jgi:flavin reductase (DIM6/NTAB) family NADH-FMN oxidoreductase RutF
MSIKESFCEVAVAELDNAVKLIGKDWTLITVKDDSKQSGVNVMTASWGFTGFLWNKSVAQIFVRPERHTYALIESENRFTLAFFGKKNRELLKFSGTKSGRELDKLAELGFGAIELDGALAVAEAELVLVCRKLYADDIKRECFIDDAPLAYYENDGLHRAYTVEIEKAYIRVGGEYDTKK